jgi:hypothetical protein
MILKPFVRVSAVTLRTQEGGSWLPENVTDAREKPENEGVFPSPASVCATWFNNEATSIERQPSAKCVDLILSRTRSSLNDSTHTPHSLAAHSRVAAKD